MVSRPSLERPGEGPAAADFRSVGRVLQRSAVDREFDDRRLRLVALSTALSGGKRTAARMERIISGAASPPGSGIPRLALGNPHGRGFLRTLFWVPGWGAPGRVLGMPEGHILAQSLSAGMGGGGDRGIFFLLGVCGIPGDGFGASAT